jgi:hypothetical protein
MDSVISIEGYYIDEPRKSKGNRGELGSKSFWKDRHNDSRDPGSIIRLFQRAHMVMYI